ncbi:hypothetical protein ACVINI_006783 [Rhizobium beringeri]|jgi:hypothetical protein
MAQHVADDRCVACDGFADSDVSVASIPYSGRLIFSPGGTLSVQAMNPGASAEPTTYTATKAIGAISTRAVPSLSEVLLLDGSRRLM